MKAKSVLSILLAAAMLLSMSVLSAGAETAAVTMDTDAQLNLIFSRLNDLRQDETVHAWYYSVTDFDHNGRLELVAAAQHQADRSKTLRMWEVSEGRDALNECTPILEEDESFPDILLDNADTFHDTATGKWSYIFYDNIVLSDFNVFTVKTSVDLTAGVVSYTPWAVEHTVVQNNARSVSYTDANGYTISQEQYNASTVNAFVGKERSNTSFDWFLFKDASIARLADSYSVFKGEKAPTEIFPVPKPAALSAPVATAAPTPAPIATPVPTPKPAVKPTYLSVTKNPTNENKKVGGTALFVACANVYDSLSWTMVSPNGGEYSAENFAYMYADAPVTGQYSTTLSIGNVATDMNGWGAYCTFYYNGQSARTSTAYISVAGAPAPAPVPTMPASGTLYGYVTDYSYDTVTILVDNTTSMVVYKDVCYVDGELTIGCDCTVYYEGTTTKGLNIVSVYIAGEDPEPLTEYGSMSGTIYSSGNEYEVILADGTSDYVPDYMVNILYGYFEEGCSCTAYYEIYPTWISIYQVDVYGVEDYEDWYIEPVEEDWTYGDWDEVWIYGDGEEAVW